MSARGSGGQRSLDPLGWVGRGLAVGGAQALPERLRHLVARAPGFRHLHGRLAERDGLAVRRVVAGPLRGALFNVDPRSEQAYLWGSYEADTQELLESVELEGGLAWDIGAHVGFFSLLLSRRCDRVVAVEPAPDNARRLRTNVKLNRASIEVVEAAVGRAPGVARIVCEGRVSQIGEGAGTVEVPQFTMDQLAERYGLPSFVKIDVEGAELDALRGAGAVLAHRSTILVEAHSPSLVEEVAALLRSAGYFVRGAEASVERFVPAHLLATP